MLTTTPRKVIVAVSASVLLIGIAFGKFGTSPSLAEQAEQTAAAMFAPSISATKTDALTLTANNADGKADPGDTIGYTVTLSNGGPDPATGLTFTDTIDPNTTLSSAVAASAVAVNDTFPVTVVGNVSVNSASLAGGPYSITTNDYLGQNPAATISAFDATTANGGQISMTISGATMGEFTYDPPAGFEGTDTFTYTLFDNAAAASAASNRTATVSITVSGMLWFINNNAAACTTANNDCGRLSKPYSSLAAFKAENGDPDVPASDFFYPAANDNIFIYESSTAYTDGVTLLQGQRLIGQDASVGLTTITGLSPPAGSSILPAVNSGNGTLVTLTNPGGNGVTLSTNNNLLRGFTVGDTGGYDIANTTTTPVGNLTILEVPLTGTGGLFRADSGGTLNVTFPSMSSLNATGNGILLSGVGGTFASPNGITITNSSGTGIGIFSTTATYTFGGTTSVVGSGNGNADTNGTGVHLTGNTGVLPFGNLSITPDSGERALYAQTNTNTLTVTGGTISSTNGTGVEITGTNAGNRTPINVTLNSVSTAGGAQAVNGIFLKWTSDAGAGFTVTGNGGTCTFATPTCTGGRITNTSAPNNTSNGVGVYLEDVFDVNLTGMRLDNHSNGAIRGKTVNNFQFVGSLVDGNNGTCDAGCDVDPTDSQHGEDAVRFTNLLGSGLIDSSTITGGWSNNLRVVNTTGTLNRLTIDDNFIGDPDAVGSGQRGLANLGDGNDGVQLHARDGITAMNVTVTNNTINYAVGDVLNILNNDNTAPVGTVDAIVRNNTLVNALTFLDPGGCTLCQAVGASNLTLAGLGHMTYDVSCNKLGNSKGIQLNVFKGHNTAGTPSGNFTGTIYNNTLGLAGVSRSGGADGASALNVDQQGTGTGTVLIKNNVIRQYTEAGIRINNIDNLGQLSTLNATVIGNTTTEPVLVAPGPAFAGLYVIGGADPATDFNQVTNIRVGSATFAAEKNNLNDGTGVTSDAYIEQATGTVNLSRAGSAGAIGNAVIVDDNIVDPVGVFVNPGITLVNTTPTLPASINEACSPAARPEGEKPAADAREIGADPVRLNFEEFQERIRRAFNNRQTNEKVLGRFKYEVQKQVDDQATETLEPQQAGSAGGDAHLLAGSIGGSLQRDVEVTEAASWWNTLTRTAHSAATFIAPTVSAESSPSTAAPFSGETVSVGPIATLPVTKSVVITFNVTVDALDAGEVRTRIVNQGTASWTGIGAAGSVTTTDPTSNADPACTAAPSVGTGTCTPVDRPDTSVTSVTRVGSTPSKAASVQWTVTFADPIAGLTASNLSLVDSAGPCTGEAITSVTGVGGGPTFTQYTVTAGTGTGDCTLRVDVANDGGISHDLTNDPFTIGETITIDKTVPTVLSINRASANPTNAASVDYAVTFSETVSGVDPTDFLPTTSGVTGVSATTVTGGPTIYTVSVNTGTGDGSFRIDLADNDSIVDAAGNPLGGAGNNNGSLTGQTYNVDKTPPTVDIVDVTPDPRNTAVSAVTINFTENVTGFDLADLTLSLNGGANLLTGAQTITGGAMSYSLNNLTGITGSDGTYVLTITAPGGITDAIGNSLVVGASEQWVMDTSKPNVTINQASGQPDPTFAQPINFTVVFNEPVTDFDDAADIELSASTTPGALTAIITQTAPNDGTTYDVAVSGATDDGLVVATITNGAAVDGAGNTSNPSTSSDNSVVFVTCTPPPSNMTAWYTGDGTLMDIAGGLDAASGGSPATVYDNGKVGQGFDLNGTSQWIERVDTTGMDTVPAAFSFDAWIFREGKLNPSAHEGVIVKMQDGAVNSQDSLGVFIQDTGAAGPAGDSFFVTYGGTLFNTANGTVPAINTWFHYAMTYDGANIRVYVNGALIDTRPYVGRTASTGPLYLGGRGAQHPFNGLIDEVEVFDKVLSLGEIQAIVAADSGGKCKPSDLSVTKTDGGVTTTPGQTITYTFAYANAGKAATGVTLTENVPANTTFNTTGSTLGWSCADGAPAGTACTFTVGSLASLGTGNATFVATVVNTLPAGITDIGNAVTIADDGNNGAELDTDDNVATDFTPVTAQPDFSLTKSDGGVSVAPGGTVTYTLTYTNNGNQGAANVTLTETVPANTTFNSASSTGTWSCSNGAAAGTTCTQNVGSLAGGGANGTRNFAVTVVNPVAAGVNQISNTASVADDGTNGADPTPANNTATDTTPVVAAPDLTISKTDGNTSTIPGGTVSYTLNYSNVGNQGATGVVLSETVPANTTFNAGASTAGWVCAPNGSAGSTCTLAVGPVNAGANGSATFAVTVNTTGLSGVTQISNTATVADDGANGADPTPANNAGSDTTPRNCQTITVNNPANASGLIGLPFSETFTQTGAFGTVTFSTASTLPAGVTLSSAGVLSGTPSEIGNFPVVVTVTDGNGCTGTSAQYNLNITCNVNPIVQNSNDAGLNSLRYAVATACSAAGQNTVTFNMSAGFVTTPISLTSGQIALTRNVNIQGPGANLLTVERNAAAAAGRVFEVAGSVTSQISGLTITGGSGPGLNGGGVQSLGNLTLIDTVVAGNTAERGAGIYHSGGGTLTLTRVVLNLNNARKGGGLLNNNGAVTITDSTISGNSSTEQGGGIINTGISMSIAGSTISGNSAGTDGGGGIFNRVPLTIANSTISGNRTDGSGGGIHSSGGGGSVIVRNSTVTNNTADFDNNGSGDGGGVFDIANQFQTAGSIIAGNMDAGGQVPDISGAPISNGYNLIGKSDGSTGFTNGVNSDQVGTIAAPLNSQLAPLANNGGLTQTHALCVAANVPHASCTGLSPAIDKGDDVVGSGFDQRGNGPNFVRPYDLPLPNFPNATGGDGSDIGAYELNNTPPTIAALPTTRQQGTAAVNSAVANVTDIESGNGSVVVTVNGGAFATVNGVTVNNIANNNGSVTANVVAACGATTATFTLTATDTGGLTATATLTVTVTPNTPPVLTYNNPAAIVFGQSGVVVSPATGPADNGAVVSNVLQSVGTYTGAVAVDPSGAVTLTGPAGPVGVHTITVRSTDNCVAFADATFQVTVNKAATTTTVSTSPNPSTYGQAVMLTATVVSNPPGAGTPAGSVTFRDGGADCATGTSLGSGTLNGSGVATLPVSTLTAGPHTIRACYGGSASHLISSGTAAHTVDKAVLTVTASSPTVTYGDAVPAITPSFSGFVLGESSTVLTTQPSCTTAYTQGSNVAGSPYQTSCSGAAAANYTFMYVNGGVTINKKQLTATADNKSRTYGAANPPLTSTITGFVLGETLATSGVTGTPSLSTTATPASPVGNYPITASAGTLAAANYSFTFANGTLTVTPATLTVTADNKTRVYGQPNPAFTFQIMGFANGETLATSGVTGAPALSTSATAASAPGSYPITIMQGTLAAANYTFAFANGTLTITQAATTTAVTNPAALAAPTAVGQAYTVSFAVAPAPPGSGTPTGMVTVSDGTGATCTGAVAANGTGSCSLTSTTPGAKTITATYNGDVNFTGSTSAGAPHQVVISITGNIRQYVPFGPSANLAGVTVTLAVNGVNVSTATTDASGNYSFGLLAGGSSIVITPSGLGKTYEPVSRTYNNVTNNIANADFVAYDAPGPNANPREIRVVNTVAMPGQSVTVPVEIVSLGNETSMSFTLAFDQALLGVPTAAACGADFAGCTVATFDTSTPGRVGITITRAAAFAAGVREAVRITFPTVPNTASSAALAFADAPVVRDVRNSDGNPVPALYKNGFVSFNQGNLLGFEGDVVDADGNPGGGDGVRANDVTVMRLFVLGLATADVPSGQFRRADAAPTAGGGDGRIDASDVTVVRLYNLGTLPPTPASGPVSPVPTQAEEDESDIVRPDTTPGRTVSVLSTRATAGQTVTTVVQLESHGDETSLSFTLNFDPVVLTYSEASLGVQAPTGTNLSLNTQQAAQGRLGVLLDATNTYSAGSRQILTVTFKTAAGVTSGSYPITFAGAPTPRSTSNAGGALLNTQYEVGNVTFAPSASGVSVAGRVTSPTGQGLRNAVVTITNAAGLRRSVTTGSFGIYTFSDVEAGQSYIVSVSSNRFRFAPRSVTLMDSLADVNFTAMQ